MPSTNVYGELNPLYPEYEDREVELQELMQYFEFAYQPTSGYEGHGVFEIKDKDKTYYMTIRAHPDEGVQTKMAPPDEDEEITFHCTLPYDTFHDVFWGYTSCKALVTGGGCTIHNFWSSWRSAFNFGMSFDMRSAKWVEYYQSGRSLKQMRSESGFEESASTETELSDLMMNDADSITINGIDTRHRTLRFPVDGIGNSMNSLPTVPALSISTIGAKLPKSRDDTEFMYQWTQSKDEENMSSECNEGMRTLQSWNGLRERMGLWRGNSTMSTSLESGSISNEPVGSVGSVDGGNEYMNRWKQWRFNPIDFGKNMSEKCKNGIQRGSRMLVDEYYGYYSQYTRDRVGAISLELITDSIHEFTSSVYRQTNDNELVHNNLLTTLF